MKKQFYKILSLILSLVMIFSVCGVTVNADTTNFGENAYFVKNGGAGDGRSDINPAPSVAAAVASINADNLKAGDTANIYVMQREDWNTHTEGVHGMAYWAEKPENATSASVPAHTAHIVVQSYDANTNSYLAFTEKVGQNCHMTLNGPTTFKNIKIVGTRSAETSIETDGNEVVFGLNTAYAHYNGYNVPTGSGTFTVQDRRSLCTAIAVYGKEAVVEEDVNLTFENDFATHSKSEKYGIVIDTKGNAKYTYEKDINLNFNNSALTPWVFLGRGSSGTTEIKGNLNINVINAQTITVSALTGNLTVGGYQVILNGNVTYTGKVADMSNVTVTNGAWYLTNDTEYTDFLAFTDVAGTYSVKSGKEAIATDKLLGNKYQSKNGVLTIPAGEYTITEYFPPKTNDYYVKNGGTGDGRSAANPAPSVAAAVTSVNADDLKAGDIANIYVMQREDWNTHTEGVHGMAYWAEKPENATSASVPAHTAHIVVQSYDANTKSNLAFTEKVGQNCHMTLNGPTTFKNIKIVGTRSAETSIETDGNEVVFGLNTAYAHYNGYNVPTGSGTYTVQDRRSLCTAIAVYGKEAVVEEDVNLTFENDFATHSKSEKYGIVIDTKGNAKYTYEKDINLNFNNSALTPWVFLGRGSSGTTEIKGNLNINVINAQTITVSALTGNLTVGGYQVILNGNVTYTGKVADMSNVTVTNGAWYLTNDSKVSDLLSFTSTAGLYAVKEGYIAVAVNDETGEKKVSENGALSLAAGEYTITAERIPVTKEYFVKNGGTGDGRTVEAPAATVADVIASVNADLFAGDVAKIYIMRGDNRATKGVGKLVGGEGVKATPEHGFTAWSTDGTFPSHDAKIVVEAYDTSEVTYLTFSDKLGANHDLVLGGTTEFDNITLVSVRRTYRQIKLCGNSVTYGPNVKYGRINHGYDDITASAWNGAVANVAGLAVYSGSGATEISDDVNIVFNNTYSSPDKNTSFYMTQQAYNKDYNITVDNEGAAPQVYLAGSSGTTSIAGNLNINVKNAKSFALYENTGTLSVGGAIQVLVDSNITYSGNLTSFEKVTAQNGKWLVVVNADMKNAVSATDTLGTYSIIDGYTAIATDSKGNEYLSNKGLLTLPANEEYSINIVEYYLNNGETINVYNDVEIDLTNEKYTNIDGKLFIGWTKSDGTFADKITTYSRGDVLTAKYVDFDKNGFVIEEAQIRDSDELGLRFIVNQNKSEIANIPNIQEYGTITLPTDIAGGREIFLDEGVVVTWKWDEKNINDFSAATRGETPVKVIANNILEEDETNIKYTLCITGVEEEYDTFYTAKGYIKFIDENGVTRVIYTDAAQTSIYKIAAEAVANGEESDVYDSIIETVKTERENYVNSVTADVKNTYQNSTTVTDEFAALSNGLRLRTMNINTGYNLEKTEIGWLSDVHLNYVNERDVNEQVVNALSGYRGRQWLREGSSINRIISAIKYTNIFDKTIVTGDMVDYQSWGSLYLTNNLITRKSVNGSILMTSGNHEFSESCQPDISGLPDVYTVEEKYQRLQSVWANDIKYHEEIVYAESGKENVMLVLLDNGRESKLYPEGTAIKLQASIDKAKSLGIPVLLFQHVPMLTMNPNETKLYVSDAYAYGFGTPENYDDIYDMTTKSSYINPNSSNEEISAVCKVIRQNPDVIKGMFNGHEHINFYSEITATDAEGNLLYDENNELVVIPQFTMSGTAYGHVSKIVIQ